MIRDIVLNDYTKISNHTLTNLTVQEGLRNNAPTQYVIIYYYFETGLGNPYKEDIHDSDSEHAK